MESAVPLEKSLVRLPHWTNSEQPSTAATERHSADGLCGHEPQAVSNPQNWTFPEVLLTAATRPSDVFFFSPRLAVGVFPMVPAFDGVPDGSPCQDSCYSRGIHLTGASSPLISCQLFLPCLVTRNGHRRAGAQLQVEYRVARSPWVPEISSSLFSPAFRAFGFHFSFKLSYKNGRLEIR